MSNGRVDTTLQMSTAEEVLGLIGEMRNAMPFLLRLSTDEKARLVKPHPGARQVIETVAGLAADEGLSPAGDDPMAADLSVFVGLTTIADALTALLSQIEDTRLQAGSEAWNEALIRYGMLRHRERSSPDLKEKLDRIRPLITSRSSRPAGSIEAPEDCDD